MVILALQNRGSHLTPETAFTNSSPGDETQDEPKWLLPDALQYLADEGDHEAIAAILSTFKTDTASRLRLLRLAVESADMAQIRTQAHAISGSARLVGAAAMVEACLEMELAASSGSVTELSKLMELIWNRFEEACRTFSN